MASPIQAQKWYTFESATIHVVPEKEGIYVIRRRWYSSAEGSHKEEILVIEEASNLRQALLDALPPLGPNLRISTNLVTAVRDKQLSFSYRIVPDKQEREKIAKSLVGAFQPASNKW